MMLQRGLAGLESVRSFLYRVQTPRGATPARPRWAMLIPPLLCGLLADLCLVFLPFRPVGEQLIPLLSVTAVIGVAVAWEVFLWQQQCRRGIIELRAIRIQGTERPPSMAPISPHLYLVPLLLSMWLIGMSLNLVIFSQVHPPLAPVEATASGHRLFSLFVALLGTGTCLRWLISSNHGVAVLRNGVWISSGKLRCFLPWETIEAVSAFHLPLLAGRGPNCLGVRLRTVEPLGSCGLGRRRLERLHALIGWHLLVPPGARTLSNLQLAQLLQMYLQEPEMRARIGAAGELGQLRSALRITGR
jgi:hypothetical protein